MNERITQLIRNLNVNGKLSREDFDKILSGIKFRLPADYLEFMIEQNGGEGFINEAYVVFWRFDDLLEFNKMYMVDTFAPGLFFIGSDGGDTAYAIRKANGVIVEVPFIGMADETAEDRASTFVDFLSFLSTQ